MVCFLAGLISSGVAGILWGDRRPGAFFYIYLTVLVALFDNYPVEACNSLTKYALTVIY